jgi:hypothetical protein
VVYLLIAKIMKPEKQTLLGNSCVNNNTRAVAKQRTQTMEELLEAVFSMQSMPRLHKELIVHCEIVPHMEAGLNASTMALRVVGGNKKGTQCLEV